MKSIIAMMVVIASTATAQQMNILDKLSSPSFPFGPKTYTNETRGFAGNPVSTHNTYTFDVAKVGQRAKLRFWASGDIGTATFGMVMLTPR